MLSDESMGALNKKPCLQMQLELAEITECIGAICVMVTHNREEVMTMAQRIAIVYLSCIEQIDNPIDIYETLVGRLVCEFTGNVSLFGGMLVEDVRDHAVIICPQLENPTYIGHGVSTRAEDKRITYALWPKKVMINAQKPDNLEHVGRNWARGAVYDIAYLGGHSVYHTKLASGVIVRVLMANAGRCVTRPTWN